MKKKFLTVLGAVLISGSLVACGESTIEKVDTASEANAEETVKEEEKPVEETKELAVGDQVNIDGLLVTVKGVRTDTGADEWSTPEKDFFVIVDVELENTTDEPYPMSSMLQLSLFNADSYSQDMSIMPQVNGSLDGEIGAGRKMAGEIAFDVEASEYYEFIFEDPIKSGQAIWKFTAQAE